MNCSQQCYYQLELSQEYFMKHTFSNRTDKIISKFQVTVSVCVLVALSNAYHYINIYFVIIKHLMPTIEKSSYTSLSFHC
jgi:hypothetical protein